MGTDEMPLTPERALDRNITRHKTRMGDSHLKNEAENQLSRLLAQGRITLSQYDAGQDFFRAWFHGAERIHDKSIFDRLLEEGRRPPPAESIMDAATAYAVMAKLLNNRGRRVFLVTLKVCCYDETVHGTGEGSKNSRMGWLIEGLDTLLAWHRAGRPQD